jgi:hypothetical protein
VKVAVPLAPASLQRSSLKTGSGRRVDRLVSPSFDPKQD